MHTKGLKYISLGLAIIYCILTVQTITNSIHKQESNLTVVGENIFENSDGNDHLYLIASAIHIPVQENQLNFCFNETELEKLNIVSKFDLHFSSFLFQTDIPPPLQD